MFKLKDTLWAGTSAALATARELEARVLAGMVGAEPTEPQKPYLLQKMGSVGIVHIKGPLLNRDVPAWMAEYGITGYPNIREAMISAAQDASITNIVLNIDSGGGAVSGVVDTAELIAKINAKVKPVVTMAGGTMASAAYWLGSSAGKVFASSTSVVGSIGVITTHMDVSKRLEQDGITATVLRAGKYKALANSLEPLSAAARAQIQEQLDACYAVFVEHVADARGVSYPVADKQMANGQEFMGQAAVDAGLIEGISNMDAVLSKLLEKKPVDNSTRLYDNGISRSNSMPKNVAALTEQSIAALESGASAATQTATALLAAAGVLNAPVDAAAQALLDKEAADKVVADKAAADKVIADKEAADKVVAPSELTTFLQAQVKEKDATILALTVAAQAQTEKLAGIETTHTALVAIARDSISKMRVALGGSAGDLSTMTDIAVLAEHQRVSAEFKDKFKVGGVGIVAPEDKSRGGVVVADPLQSARIAATKKQAKK